MNDTNADNPGDASTTDEHLPTDEWIAQRLTALERHGVAIECRCGKCDGTAETKILPGEETPEASICRECALTTIRA